MTETAAVRRKRLKIRAWRRGMREMDVILGPFFDAEGAGLSPTALDAFERLLDENDQDLYRWISGQDAVPEAHQGIIAKIRAATELHPAARRS